MKDSTIEGIIAHDIEDKIVRFEEAKKIAAAWKNAKFIETTDLGHSLHDPNLYETIVAFVGK